VHVQCWFFFTFHNAGENDNVGLISTIHDDGGFVSSVGFTVRIHSRHVRCTIVLK